MVKSSGKNWLTSSILLFSLLIIAILEFA
ncbi:hypothetical protein E2R66_00785 [Mucilaginibacter psychrotolerans]|uniref:Uncharacterized protein n=1 Tax=Mucilaginibacter psychrotolerans TaxID=1524096 RepID=A0A4Y8SQ43_9SPHI|nr:hypothetical protein E2R66_00785 [Mucilaginibacter psychrotolerans]